MKKYVRYIFTWLSFIFICLSVIGCVVDAVDRQTSEWALTQTSPISTETERVEIFTTCSPPCWENLTPGVSQEEDVIRELDRLQSEGKIKSYLKSEKAYRAELSRGGNPINISLADNKVSLTVVEDTMYSQIRVEDVVNYLGEPEAYLGRSKSDRESCACENWDDRLYAEAPSVYPHIIYPTKGLAITMLVPIEYLGCVCPKMRASLFYFFPPVPIDEALNDPNHILVKSFNLNRETVLEWHGYGPGY